jgi:hypothetical protein
MLTKEASLDCSLMNDQMFIKGLSHCKYLVIEIIFPAITLLLLCCERYFLSRDHHLHNC